MLCDGCKKNDASIVLHMMTNGQLATRSLCQDCAKKAHSEMSRAFNTMGIRMEGLNGMVGETEQNEPVHIPRMFCATCRTAYDTIDNNTVFGCPSCYSAFHEQVVEYLSSLKPAPKANMEHEELTFAQLPPTKELLEQRLQEALQQEDYEMAAGIRDQLAEAAREAWQEEEPGV